MLLGELQYAFATFFYGHSFEGFRQWKELLIILTNCDSAIREIPDFFVHFVGMLSLFILLFIGIVSHYCYYLDVALPQIEQVPEDFFYDNISGNNFLKQIFKVSLFLFSFLFFTYSL